MTAEHPSRHRVFQVTGLYPPSLGGVQVVARSLAQQLARHHEVEVVTTSCGADRAPRQEFQGGVRIRRFCGVVVARTPLSLGLALRLLMIRRDAIVHLHVGCAFIPEMVLLTSILRRRPYLAHFHMDMEPSGRFGILWNTYKRVVLGSVLRRASAVIVLADEQVDFLAEEYGLNREAISVIPNGVDAEFFSQRTELTGGPADGPLRLLYVGRLDVQKNPLRLVDAMSQVSADVDLVVVGDGELREATARRIAELGLSNIRLVGPARSGQLLDWYSWADAFVLPSDREGMPLVLLEAMAAGLAIIATDVPGTREAVGGVGLLAAPDPVALGAAIDRVALEAGLIEELCARSTEAAAGYRWESRVPELERVYELVVGS